MRGQGIIFVVALLFGCTAVQQQKSQPPATDDLRYRNLQVLPQNITRDELLTTMRRFRQALDVGCDYCHAANKPASGPTSDGRDLNFASDEKPAKHAARLMILMTRRINEETISRIPDAHTTVTCWTCHRGEVQPAIVPSLPPRNPQPAPPPAQP